MSAETPLGRLSKLLVHPDQKLLITLRGVIPSKDIHQLAESFVRVFEHEGKALSLIEHLISAEIDATVSSGTLFRTNSLASKVMTLWSRLGEGTEYLTATLAGPIGAICSNRYGSLEINPEHARPEEDLAANVAQLSSIAQEILDCITSSVDRCPLAFRVVCNSLKTQCTKKFPSQSLMAVGGFIILRFFSAALVTPETNGLLEDAPSLDARRILVLVSKTIQNLANHAWFRESFMDALNKFLETNQDKMTAFLENVSEVPAFAAGAAPPPNQIPQEEYESALGVLAEICARNIKFMESQVPDPDPAIRKAFVEELRGVISGFQQGSSGASQSSSGAGSLSSSSSDVGAAAAATDPRKAKEERKKKEKEQKSLDKKHKELERVERLVAKGKKPKAVADELPRRRRDLRIQMEQMVAEHLTQAAAIGDIQAIEETLSKEKKMVNVIDREGQTALHHAASNGHVAVVRLLLKLKADCYLTDKRGWTALHCACFANHEEVIAELCHQRHIDVTTPNDDENTPLHYLARNPFTKTMSGLLKLFLQGGADINAQNNNLETPLHMAVWKANPGMIALLLENGADPKLANNKGETPWDWALRLKNPELIAVFERSIKQRALQPPQQHAPRKQNPLMADATLRSKFFLDAVRDNQADTVRELLRLDKKLADQTFGASKSTALHYAVIHGHLAVTKLIVRAATKLTKNAVGWTPLMAALWQGHEEAALVIMLSHHTVDVNAKLEDGNTALHFAARHAANLAEFVVFSLLEHAADINATNTNGDTPLHYAVRGGRAEVVRCLLENGANRQKANKDHETPMDLAQKMGNVTILNILLDKPVSQLEDTATSEGAAAATPRALPATPPQQQRAGGGGMVPRQMSMPPPSMARTTLPPPPLSANPGVPLSQSSGSLPASQQQKATQQGVARTQWTQLAERIVALSVSSTQAQWDQFVAAKRVLDNAGIFGTETFCWPPSEQQQKQAAQGERLPTLRDLQSSTVNRISEMLERLKKPDAISLIPALDKAFADVLAVWP